MPIGVVGCLAILQGATSLYEYLFGNIQFEIKESGIITSAEDNHTSEDLVNQPTNQSIRSHGDEKCEAVVAGLSNINELGDKNPRESMKTGEVSSCDYLEEIGQIRTAGLTTKHLVTSQTKDHSYSHQEELGQSNEADASKTEPNKAHCEVAEGSVQFTPGKEQPKKFTSHEDEASTNEVVMSKMDDEENELMKCGSSEESVSITSIKEHLQGTSSTKEQDTTSECIVGKKESIGAEPTESICDKTTKMLIPVSSNGELKTTIALKDLGTTIKDIADKTGCKGKVQDLSVTDQSLSNEADGDREQDNEKQSVNPSLFGNAEHSFQLTPIEEQTKQLSEKEEIKLSSSGVSADFEMKNDYLQIPSKEQVKELLAQEHTETICGEEKVSQNVSSDDDTKALSCTSSKGQPKAESALQDQSETCPAVGNDKEPMGSGPDNFEDTNPTAPSETESQTELDPKHLGPIDEAYTDEKTKEGCPPKVMGNFPLVKSELDLHNQSENYVVVLNGKEQNRCRTENAKETNSTTTGEKQEQRKLAPKDLDQIDEADADMKTREGNVPKSIGHGTCSDKKDNSASSGKMESNYELTEREQSLLCQSAYCAKECLLQDTQEGQLQPVATSEGAMSSISSHQFYTNSVEDPTTELTISAKESKSELVTVPILSESITSESLGEKLHKDAKLVVPVTDMSQNVLVRHAMCNSSKTKGLCVRQKFSTVLSTILEETSTELANLTTSDERKMTGSLQVSQGQSNIIFPTTHEADLKVPVGYDRRLSASTPAFVPATTTPVLQPLGYTSSVNQPKMYDPSTKAALMTALPVQQGITENTPKAQSRMQTSVTVRHQQGQPTTEFPKMSTSSAAYNPYLSTPKAQKQGNLHSAINHKSTPVLYMYPEQLTAHSSMAASPVQQGPTDNMSSDQRRVQNSVPVSHQQRVCTTEVTKTTRCDAAYATSALMMQQQGYTPFAVNVGSTPILYMYPNQLADYLSMAASPVQQGPTDNVPTDQPRMQESVPGRHQQEEVPSTITGTAYRFIPSSVITTNTPSQQQFVQPHIYQRYPVTSLGIPTTQNPCPTMTTSVLEQGGQRNYHARPVHGSPVTNMPETEAAQNACNTPKAAAQQTQQQPKTSPVVMGVTTAVIEEPNNVCHSELQICASSEAVRPNEGGSLATTQSSNTVDKSTTDETEPTTKPKFSRSAKRRMARGRQRARKRAEEAEERRAVETEERAAEVEKGETGSEEAAIAVTLEQTEEVDIGNPGGVSSSSANVRNLDDDSHNAMHEEVEAAVPSYHTDTSKAKMVVTQLARQQSETSPTEVDEKVTSPKVLPVTNEPTKEASPTASSTPNAAAAPLSTQGVQEVTTSKEVSNTDTSQQEAQSDSINATMGPVTVNDEPNNICHSKSQFCASSHDVEPREEESLTTAQLNNTVETSATDETESTSKPKLSKSKKRIICRIRQRARKRAAEAEKRTAGAETEQADIEGTDNGPRAAEAGKKAAETKKEDDESQEEATGTITVKAGTEGTESTIQGEAAPSRPNETIRNDVSLCVNDEEREAVIPFNNSDICDTPKPATSTTLQQPETPLNNVGEMVTPQNDVPVTIKLTKEASPTACNRPKAAAPHTEEQPKTTVAVQEVTTPKVICNTNKTQQEAQSDSINTTMGPVTASEEPNNICHSQSQFFASSQDVEPSGEESLATAQSNNTVETSATDETVATTKRKLSKSTKRRMARARQRARKRAAEVEQRTADAEEVTTETEKTEEAEKRTGEVEKREVIVEKEEREVSEGTVQDAEGVSSTTQGEVASSRVNEIIVDEDSPFAIDWETEAAMPIYNSTEIFRPSVAIPDLAELNFSQNQHLQHLGWENTF